MSRRNLIIIILAVGVVLLLIISGIILWFNFRPTEVVEPPADPSKIQIPTGLPQSSASAGITDDSSPIVEVSLEANLKAVASTFAERFGSYSNQNNFSNLDDLSSLMTVKMKAWVDNYKAAQAPVSADEPYYGVTTQAVAVKISSFDEDLGRAKIVVSTQRQENKGSTVNPRVSYQDLELDLVKTGQGWKVDVAEWQ